MYQKKYWGKPQSNNRRKFSGPRPHNQGQNQGKSRFSGNRSRKNRFSKDIDPRLFVKKAVDFKTIEDTDTIHAFEDFGLNEGLLNNIKAKGYIKPTSIQDEAIEPILRGSDILGLASTGSGKTAAFAIPLINKILENPQKRILILAPTRELASQIKQEMRSFCPGLKVYYALAIGGAFLREQIIDIKRGPNVIIGTPGRVTDLGKRKVIDFSKFDTVVLDEVDRMLDMGFINEIKAIMERIPDERQTLFFSATVDNKIEALIDTLLRDPVKIKLKTQDSSDHVDQDVVRVGQRDKEEILFKILSNDSCRKVLIFRTTKIMTEKLSRHLIDKGFKAGSIHGDKMQHQRQRVLQSFKNEDINILVATDVAARGLDIPNVTHVINFDVPQNYEDYIHRIGRTGRGNAKGTALTFID